MSRKYMNKLLQMVDDGIVDEDTILLACLKYMSEDEIEHIMCIYGLLEDEYEDEDEDEECDPMKDFTHGYAK